MGRLLTLAFAFLLTLGFFAPQSRAAAPQSPSSPTADQPAPRSFPLPKSPKVPDDARPVPGEALTGGQDAPRAGTATQQPAQQSARSKAQRSAPNALAAASCTPDDFAKTGTALVQQVTSVDVACMNSLFNLDATGSAKVFREGQMATVADALRAASATYDGTNNASIGQLVLFLRVGYYVQWRFPDQVGAYGAALAGATRAALDAFFGAPRSKDVTQANGETLSEAVILIDSAHENARYTGVVKWLLNSLTPSTGGAMWNAVDSTRTVIENGTEYPGFIAALQADPSFAAAMAGLVTRNSSGLTGGDLATSIGIQLGSLVSFPELKAQARPLVKDLINRYPLVGASGPLTMNLAWFAENKDKGNCSYYGICDLPTRLVPLVLTVDHTCSPSLRIRAQHMSATELADTCTSLADQDAFFHSVVKDDGPVAGDRNKRLEVVVFDSYYDYSLYAWSMYDIEVDNGGMYLEGDPTKADNQARFIAHEATWERPAFQIWNLNHEYTHYLDGRYDMAGDFDAGMTTPTIWWVEGIAEYVSYSYRDVRYDDAIAQAAKGTYKLSQLFDTTYDNADSTRIYNWGYLAVRYMLQSHPQDMAALLARYRAGDWAGARTLLTSTIGTRYDADFATWLTACGTGRCGTLQPPQAPLCTQPDTRQYDKDCRRDGVAATTGNYDYMFVYLPAGVRELTITSSGGTGNGDLYYNGSSWATTSSYLAKSTGTGNGETLTISNPPSGWVFFSLYAQQGFSGASVTTRY
ncbi:collagenase [Kitasatospora sp. NPDC096147]|uniref:M9 family metallopeptidase n=1 Tax=Kitasatospora sp. NPDC096147 TaxID=3364093 RepID=UPI0038268BFF